MAIITIKEWVNKNTKKPLLLMFVSVFIIQIMILTFWTVYSKSKQHQQIDQLVRIASHGITHNNRPLLESILNMGFNELNSNLIVICRKNSVILAYPATMGTCVNLQESFFESLITKKGYGNLDYTFYFLIPILPSLRIWLLLLMIMVIILFSGGYLTWKMQKNINDGILAPLQTDFNDAVPMAIKELEDIRQNLTKYTELKVRNATAEAIAGLTKHMAHDLRKPLSQVRVILDAFDLFKNNPSRLKAARDDIKKAINNVEGMLADVLNFSREIKLSIEPRSLAKVLNFTIRQVALSYVNANIEFVYHLNADKKPLMDEARFNRALANIIGNGIEAITIIGNKGHGTIDISTSSYEAESSFVEIIIGNNGPLFPPGIENKLFKSFFTSGKASGTGLGLASAKKIVDLHDGEIFARNKVDGEGVEFIIRLPASEDSEEVDMELLPMCSGDILQKQEDLKGVNALIKKMEGRIFKIILLEDEALYRAWVKNLIQSNETLQKSVILYDANTVEEAIQLVANEKPSHAIVDIDLGTAKNGYDFLDAVKSNATIKTIVHSNRTLEEFKQKATELGASDFIPKPLPLSSLVEFLTGEKIQAEEVPKQDNAKMIYCCDDSQLIRDHLDFLLSEYLKDKANAFEYQIFKNGEELIKQVMKRPPILVLTDLNMKETGGQLNGYDVIKEIKRISRKTKAYLISNEPHQLSEEPTKKAGGDGALEQPLSKEVLFSLLDEHYPK